MPTTAPLALFIPEVLECIFQQLDDPADIIRTQRVCTQWQSLIRTSPALQEACWYTNPRVNAPKQPSNPPAWILNPVFARLGVSLGTALGSSMIGDFNLKERVYDLPGSWTTMLATQPLCRRIEVECYTDYSADENMSYFIESSKEPLRVGDVMAVLAECQNRQDHGVDRWAGVRHYDGIFKPRDQAEKERFSRFWPSEVFDTMSIDVSIRVVVSQAWDSGEYPAFSLQQIYPADEQLDEVGRPRFLHELIVHDMVSEGIRYRWSYEDEIGDYDSVCKAGKYGANLVAVKDYEGEYLSACRHIFRLLSDI